MHRENKAKKGKKRRDREGRGGREEDKTKTVDYQGG
jgi:hypothetical protein